MDCTDAVGDVVGTLLALCMVTRWCCGSASACVGLGYIDQARIGWEYEEGREGARHMLDMGDVQRLWQATLSL